MILLLLTNVEFIIYNFRSAINLFVQQLRMVYYFTFEIFIFTISKNIYKQIQQFEKYKKHTILDNLRSFINENICKCFFKF